MKNVFLFFRQKGAADQRLERDFRVAYQESSLHYLQLAFVLGILGYVGFLAMDLIHGTVPAVRGVFEARGAICLMYVVGLALTTFKRSWVARRYTVLVNFVMSIGMLGAALVPMALHGNSSNADIYWSVNSSLTTGAIVIYGTSRLTARNTALIVVTGCLIGIGTVLLLPTFEWYPFGRLAFHLTFVNLAAFSLRETVERHERSLFLLARENLSKNVYAKELEVARAQAEEGNAIKMRFLANMSHEFRTPMNGVMQTLELAGRTADRELAELIDRARRSGSALLQTLNGILEYTRWTQDTLSQDRSTVRVSELLRTIVRRHQPLATECGLAMVLRLDLLSSEEIVTVDRLMVEEVVSQLLDNAIRFTPSGQISVRGELAHRRGAPYPAAILGISITDTGIGIAEADQQAIYNPFYQLDDGSNRRVGGTGLGLAIVRRLVEVMEGQITVQSAVGAGSTFRVSIPVEICKTSAPLEIVSSSVRATRPSFTTLPLEGMVLLAEDNELNGMLAAELLSLMGLKVTWVADGVQAVRAAEAHRFDVILMDCQMPNVDGYEATRLIRRAERNAARAQVPILAVTANALAGDRQKCLAAGMNDYLAKPYTAAELRAKLVTWLPQPLGAFTDSRSGVSTGAANS